MGVVGVELLAACVDFLGMCSTSVDKQLPQDYYPLIMASDEFKGK